MDCRTSLLLHLFFLLLSSNSRAASVSSRSPVGGTATSGTATSGARTRATLREEEKRSPTPAQQGRRHPHAARGRRGSAPWARTPRSAPRCAAEPVPLVQQPRTGVWTHPGGKHFFVAAKRAAHSACRLGNKMRPDRRRVVQLVIVLPGPGHTLSPWSGVVLHLGQCHSCRKNCLRRRSHLQAIAVALASMMKSRISSNAKTKVTHGPKLVVVVIVTVTVCWENSDDVNG